MVLRRLIPLALTVGMAAALVAAGPAVAAAGPLQLTLPAPTGPDAIGTVALHLIQADRPDPFVAGRPRELMVSLTYPARHAGRYPTAPYMTAGEWAAFEHAYGISEGAVVMPRTAGHAGAPVDRRNKCE